MPLAVVADGKGDACIFPATRRCPPPLTGRNIPFLQQPMTNDKRWFSPPLYGLPNFSDLFTHRQLVALTTFSDLVQEVRKRIGEEARINGLLAKDHNLTDGATGAEAYADAIATYLAFAVSKASSRNCSLAVWEPGTGFAPTCGALGRQALPMQWTFAETNPLSGAGGDISGTAESVSKVIDDLPVGITGTVEQLGATVVERPAAVSTDPPYYDNIGYADLSDFFYVWLRRSLVKQYPIALCYRPDTKDAGTDCLGAPAWRKQGGSTSVLSGRFGKAFSRMRQLQNPNVPLTVYYAFKQAETDEEGDSDEGEHIGNTTVSTGWETMLAGLIRSGFSIHGTWPIRTEAVNALKKDVGALASSIVLVCRPRSDNCATGHAKGIHGRIASRIARGAEGIYRRQHCPCGFGSSCC